MTRIIIESSDNDDLSLIRALADRLKIKYKIQKIAEPEDQTVYKTKELFNVIKEGTDVSNFGDPSLWQKKVRENRDINLS